MRDWLLSMAWSSGGNCRNHSAGKAGMCAACVSGWKPPGYTFCEEYLHGHTHACMQTCPWMLLHENVRPWHQVSSKSEPQRRFRRCQSDTPSARRKSPDRHPIKDCVCVCVREAVKTTPSGHQKNGARSERDLDFRNPHVNLSNVARLSSESDPRAACSCRTRGSWVGVRREAVNMAQSCVGIPEVEVPLLFDGAPRSGPRSRALVTEWGRQERALKAAVVKTRRLLARPCGTVDDHL